MILARMKHLHWKIASIALLFGFTCSPIAAAEIPEVDAPEPRRPNVLFIAVDDLNDWVGCLGGHPQSHTPNIDALAESGTLFVHAHAPAPVCGPARTAILYGLAPHKSGSYGHHEVYSPQKRLPEGQLPLTLVFQQNGYYTVGCGKIFHYPEERGWDEFRGNIRGIAPTQRIRPGPDIQLTYGIQDTDNDSDTSDGRLTDWAIEQLQRDHEKPFFIALGLRKPHLPWDAPKKYYELHDHEEIQLPHVPENALEDLPDAATVFARSIVGFRDTDDHKAITAVDGAWQELVRAYLATSSFADANVGRLLDALEESSHADNTIVVLWGDHGWHLGEKESWRKMTLWERGTRTIFVIRTPGSEANGSRVEAPVSLQNIFPTLVDLCQLEVDQELDGVSLKSLLNDPSIPWDHFVLMSHGPGNFAVRHGQWCLIRYADGSEELYDIHKDPAELNNLANLPEYNDQRTNLRRHLPGTWQYIMGPRFKNFESSFAPPPEQEEANPPSHD